MCGASEGRLASAVTVVCCSIQLYCNCICGLAVMLTCGSPLPFLFRSVTMRFCVVAMFANSSDFLSRRVVCPLLPPITVFQCCGKSLALFKQTLLFKNSQKTSIRWTAGTFKGKMSQRFCWILCNYCHPGLTCVHTLQSSGTTSSRFAFSSEDNSYM